MRSTLFSPKWHLVSRALLWVYRVQQEIGDPRLTLLILAAILVSLTAVGMAIAM